MLKTTPSLLKALSDFTNYTPTVMVDLYADKGEKVRLDSMYDWIGNREPNAQALSVWTSNNGNVSRSAAIGSALDLDGFSSDGFLQLGRSTTGHSVFVGGIDAAQGAEISVSHTAKDIWHRHKYSRRYVHDTWLTTDSSTPSIKMSFIAGATHTVTTLSFSAYSQSRYNAAGVELSYTVNGVAWATKLVLSIIDDNGNIIGRVVKSSSVLEDYSLNASTNGIVSFVGIDAFVVKGNRYTLAIDFDRPDFAASSSNLYVRRNLTILNAKVKLYFLQPDSASEWTIKPSSYLNAPTIQNAGVNMGGDYIFSATGSALRSLDVGAIPTGTGIIKFSDVVPANTTLQIDLYYTDSASLFNTDGVALVGISPATRWVEMLGMKSGDVIDAHRYFRVKISMTSNSRQDITPSLDFIELSFNAKPVTLSSEVVVEPSEEGGDLIQQTVGALDSISAFQAQMVSELKKNMVGKTTIRLSPDSDISGLMMRNLRGRKVDSRVGFDGVSDSIKVSSGIVEDVRWNRGHWQITVSDAIDITNAAIPRDKLGGVWDGSTTYDAGDKVIYGGNGWTAKTNNTTNITPIEGASWTVSSSVWLSVIYDATTALDGVAWHLADIAKDILTNHINIDDSYIDFASFDLLKSLFPLRTGSRSIVKPIKAYEAIAEIAWLLESQFVVVGGKMAMISEPPKDTVAVDVIGSNDIELGSLEYRRGWKELKNQCLIFSGYLGEGDDASSFTDGEVFVSADSIEIYDMVGFDVFSDKWNIFSPEIKQTTVAWADATSYALGVVVAYENLEYRCVLAHTSNAVNEPDQIAIVSNQWGASPYVVGDIVFSHGKNFKCLQAHTGSLADEPISGANFSTYWASFNWWNVWERNEVKARAKAVVDRWSHGRRVVSFNGSMRLSRLETGDVVYFSSNQMPPTETESIKMLVIGKSMDWSKGKNRFTLREL